MKDGDTMDNLDGPGAAFFPLPPPAPLFFFPAAFLPFCLPRNLDCFLVAPSCSFASSAAAWAAASASAARSIFLADAETPASPMRNR